MLLELLERNSVKFLQLVSSNRSCIEAGIGCGISAHCDSTFKCGNLSFVRTPFPGQESRCGRTSQNCNAFRYRSAGYAALDCVVGRLRQVFLAAPSRYINLWCQYVRPLTTRISGKRAGDLTALSRCDVISGLRNWCASERGCM